MSGTKTCPLLHKLPPELRLRIYECLVIFEGRLVPPATNARHAEDTTSIDSILFVLNQQIHDEAIDVFYARNKFVVRYEQLCTCLSMRRPIMINEFRLRNLKIQGVEFRDCPSEPLCGMCISNGLGLLGWLNSFSRLRSVSIAFANVGSFARCSGMLMDWPDRLSGPQQTSMTASQVGRLHVTGLQVQKVELRSPIILRTWPAASSMAKISFDFDDSDSDDEPKKRAFSDYGLPEDYYAVYKTLRDILYHAVSLKKTVGVLQPFMSRMLLPKGLQVDRLSRDECASLTVILAECMSEMIDEEDGDVFRMVDRSDLVEIQ